MTQNVVWHLHTLRFDLVGNSTASLLFEGACMFGVLCLPAASEATVTFALQRQQVCRVPLHWGKVPATVHW